MFWCSSCISVITVDACALYKQNFSCIVFFMPKGRKQEKTLTEVLVIHA